MAGTNSIFHIAGNMLAIAALTLLVWALLRDRLRNRPGPRCPKCWYDMRGVTGLVCPECGCDARNQRRLLKRKKHWRLAACAVALLLVAYGVWTTPRVHRSGWIGAVPTTAIIAGLPWLAPPVIRVGSVAVARPDRKSIAQRLINELLGARLQPSEIWAWQENLLIRRCLNGDRRRPACSQEWEAHYEPILHAVERSNVAPSWLDDRLDDVGSVRVICRDRWPAGLPIYAEVRPYRYRDYNDTLWRLEGITNGLEPREGTQVKGVGSYYDYDVIHADDPWRDSLVDIGSVPVAAPELFFNQHLERGHFASSTWHTVSSGPLHIPTRIITDPGLSPEQIAARIVIPKPSESIETGLRDQVYAYLYKYAPSSGADVVVDPSALSPELRELGATLALRIELLSEDRVFARGQAWWAPVPTSGAPDELFLLYPMGGNRVHLEPVSAQMPPSAEDQTWTLRLIGDPVVALRNFTAKACWDGQVTRTMTPAPARR